MAAVSNGAWISKLADVDPRRPALTVGARTLTRREFDQASNRAARRLAEMGASPGSYVSIALPNGVAFPVATVGAWKIGAVPQPISSRMPAHERDAILSLVRPSVFLTGEFDIPADMDSSPLPDAVAPAWKATTSGGSTGTPKVIVDGRAGVVDPEHPIPYHIPKDGVAVIPGPMYHTAPFNGAMRALLAGCHVIVMEKFDPEQCLALIEGYRATFISLVPTMMNRIWSLPSEVREKYDLSSLDVVWHSGGPCAPWLKQAWIDWLGADRIWELYGATERQATTDLSGAEWLARPGTVGRVAFGEMRIVGEDGEVLAPGEIGLIQARAPEAERPTYRYLGAESVILADGWETVGDMGSIDADGYLTLADRRTDLIVRGGANVFPAEVESAIDSHPAVESSIVIGIPDDDLGARVHAIIHLHQPTTAQSLVDHVGTRLDRYKIPQSWEITDTVLRDDAGKVRRSALRAERLEGRFPGPALE